MIEEDVQSTEDEIVIRHCGKLSEVQRTLVTWFGKPDEGGEECEITYRCSECETRIVVKFITPDWWSSHGGVHRV